ncbi:hypothetical protein CEXT_292491 [Caerostris extrusa]|uniref:Uncharacterized protein n=1 Tax=Caerostris extrusa TaxID=172846 RepID=A0AAV4W844_CAEEX|nr:hypothetical protein CEXT_292491 [Caerostris extrusa]
MDAHVNIIFLEEVPPEILTIVPAHIQRIMLFQDDVALSNYGITVRDHLGRTFGDRWFGGSDPVAIFERVALKYLEFGIGRHISLDCLTLPFNLWI